MSGFGALSGLCRRATRASSAVTAGSAATAATPPAAPATPPTRSAESKAVKQWLIGGWTNGVWRNANRARLSFGLLVEVPAIAQKEPAYVLDSNDSGLRFKTFSDGPRV
ncbi:hypothetical protein CNMCM5793_005345 [Aspergillus hiratsukae]|nr:hypothetical protein CNMCM5793_005345 [Aspergillus hiratsukae]